MIAWQTEVIMSVAPKKRTSRDTSRNAQVHCMDGRRTAAQCPSRALPVCRVDSEVGTEHNTSVVLSPANERLDRSYAVKYERAD